MMTFDRSLFLFINHLPHNFLLDGFFGFLSTVGSAGAVWIILGMTVFLWEIRSDRKKDSRFLLTLIFSLAATFLLIEFLKPIFARPRPDMAIMDSFSFPSGHSAIAFAGAAILSFKKKKWRPFFYLLAILISFSRIYLGEHYPLDVVGGGIIGFIISRLFLSYVQT